MALATSAWGYDGKSYTGKDMRQMVEAVAPSAGVASFGGFAVTQNGGGATTVLVAAGTAVIDATGAGLLGSFATWNDASLASPAFTATTTNGRKDRLILRVTAGVPALEIVQGTAAPSPTEPAITGDNYLELAMITLPSSTTNILTSMITDRRAWASGSGALIVATSTTRPATGRPGQMVYETDTGAFVFTPDGGTTWKRTGHSIPHSDVAHVTAGGARSITSTTYVDWPTDVVQIASFVKARADTILIVEAIVTNCWADAGANYTIGVRVNAVDYDCANISLINSVGNYHVGGWNKITGLAAGTYTCVFRHKISASTFRADANTRILLKVTETMDKAG